MGYESPLLAYVDAPPDVLRFAVRPVAPKSLEHVDGLLAGAAEVDITPPPGMPKAGFSKNAHDGVGFRTRLRARVLHLRAGRSSIALVQLDLLAGSSLLQHLVAASIADTTDVPLAGVFLGATHTHAAPGHFDASAFYNRFAGNRPGFDPAWTQFLVDRISSAVSEAVATRRPARLAVGRTDVWGLTRNRSLAPHLRNESVADKRAEPQRKWAAINPSLHLIRVDAADAPLAAAAIFSIHGTGVSHHNHEYHADVWAYLTNELSHRIELSTGARPIVGAIEGTHADCAPSLRPGKAGFLEAERIGRGIGAAAAALYDELEPSLTSDVELGVGLREVDMDGLDGGAIDDIRLPPPFLGASQVAGAKENTTPVLGWLPPFRAGMPKPHRRTSAHGAKWVLGSRRLQPIVLPLRQFPRVWSVHVLRIGGTIVAGFPIEITVEAGRRLAGAIAAATDRTAEDVVVSSVADGYFGYCTTPEEYALQYYEGGHTLYGPKTQAWLGAHAAALARRVTRESVVSEVLGERRFELPAHRYLARTTGARGARADLGAPMFHDPTGDEAGYWEMQWRDAEPGALAWHAPMARVERDDGTVAADDQGCNLAVASVGSNLYRVRWIDPWLGGGRKHRFVLEANNVQPETAGPFFD